MPRITIRPARAADRTVRQVVRDLLSRRMPKALWGLCLATALLPAQAQEVYYIHTDALGSPVAETDANRNVVKRYEYEPYGRRLNGGNDDKPGYTGHVMDAATGLVQMQQRYYDPEIGRTLSVDPVTAYDNGDMRFFNRYAYAFNNPYTFIDPDGRASGAAARDLGRVIRALWNSKGDPEKFTQLYDQYSADAKGGERFVLEVIVDMSHVGIMKDAVEISIDVANDRDGTAQGTGALVGEGVGRFVEKKLDGKIGGEAASAAGAAVGKAVGDTVEAGMRSSSNDSSGSQQPLPSAPKPDDIRDKR